MSQTVRVEPTVVVLPSAIWRTELTDELVRLGVPAEQAPLSAGKVLHRICGHHGWPKEAIQVASSDGDEAMDLEVTS